MTERRFTPESYNRRVNNWDGDGASYATFPHRTDEELRARFISDTERTAISLLTGSNPNHPVLDTWIQQLTTDLAHTAYPPRFEHDESVPRRAIRCDRAIIELGYALITHRLSGEEGHRYGFPLTGSEVSPLSQAIVDFHLDIATTWAAELQRVKLGIN